MYAVDDIRVEERPVPCLEPGDVLVRMAASGVCGSDMMPWYVRRKAPFVFGHEPAGTIVALNGQSTLQIGDRVFMHHHVPCLQCIQCMAGRYVHCPTWRATALDPGGMAEYVRVPRANLADTFVLPPSLSFADGSLLEPLACVVKSLRRAFPRELGAAPFALDANAKERRDPLAGRTLYVIGAGVTGLMHVALAATLGATVIASDFFEVRRMLARRLGAIAAFAPEHALAALREANGDRLADVVICGPGKSAALTHAVEAVANDGTVLMFTPIAPDERFEFDQSTAYFRDVRLVASYSCGPPDTAQALRTILAGIVSVGRLDVTEFTFPAVAEAYAAMGSGNAVKAIVTFAQPGDGAR